MKSSLLGALACSLIAGPLSAAEPYCAPRAPAGNFVTPAGYGHAGGYALDIEDSADRYASGLERWCDNIKDCVRDTRRLGYKRQQKQHRDLLYPQCPPYCSPTHGYYHTRWRRFSEECEYMWSGAPDQVIYESPAMGTPSVPLSPTPEYLPPQPPSLAPPAAEPYFPEAPPVIRPADPGVAPPAPEADPTAPPAPPPEVDLDPAGGTFLPARPAIQPAALEEPPALLKLN